MLLELFYICVYFFSFLSCICGYILYNNRNVIKEKYEKYTLIKKHVEESTDKDMISNVSIICIAMTLLRKFIWIFFTSKIQRWIDSFLITETKPDHFTIQFCIKKKLIKINLKLKRGPSDIIQILGDDEVDITDEIQPYFNYKIISVVESNTQYKKMETYLVNGEVHDLSLKLKEDINKL